MRAPAQISRRNLTATIVLALLGSAALASELAQFGFDDLMKVRKITSAVVAERGDWIAYAVEPDRGDGEAFVQQVHGLEAGSRRDALYRVPLGADPALSGDSRWAALRLHPSFEERERRRRAEKKSSGKKDDELQDGLSLLATADGARVDYEGVQAFAFSNDSRWLLVHFHPKDPEDAGEGSEEGEVEAATASGTTEPGSTGATRTASEEPGEEKTEESAEKEKPRKAGGRLLLRRLEGGDESDLDDVERFALSDSGRFLAYSRATESGEDNALILRDLASGDERTLHQAALSDHPALAWSEDRDRLAFLAGTEEEGAEEKAGETRDLTVGWIDAGATAAQVQWLGLPDGDAWEVAAKGDLVWTRDGERLFFGLVPRDAERGEQAAAEEEPAAGGDGEESDPEPIDPFDLEAILGEREVDVWHWDDPLINSHQKKRWNEEKDHSYRAVAHLDSALPDTGKVIRLGDRDLPEVATGDALWTVATSDVPYRKERTWDGTFRDLYLVSLADGSRRKVAERLSVPASGRNILSPAGDHAVFYRDGDWHLFDRRSDSIRNLTAGLDVSFANEDHDYPSEPPGYGTGGWVAEGEGPYRDRAVLLYDKYDVWQFSLGAEAEPLRLTDGREQKRIYRVHVLEPEQRALGPGEALLLSGYEDLEKSDGFYRGQVGRALVEPLRVRDKRLRLRAKAEDSDVVVYTEETYGEFPDLWVADTNFRRAVRHSDVNPQLRDFAWGSAELVEWSSLDGERLQGVLIKPANYQEGRRYPVLVYFYRFFSQRLHEFNDPAVNHRPSFPVYAGDGYAVFLPDIRFEVGRPGPAAVKSLVPGVQKLVDLGIADPQAIGLHGHSWSGYQTAFIVTQTDLFAAAVAGAPVSNMTSAYSGIRWQTGLARQFQYEKTQSRIGGSLWEYPERYIENSPVFFADRIDTPLLIQFGDEDGAVPWYQGIELYLALRRLGKECVFLQYRGEGHHLAKYANKLDYALKMKEFFDHHLKGAPAPEWWSEGVPYEGK